MALTPSGKQVLQLQLPPEIGCMVLHGVKNGVGKEVVNLAALLFAGSYVFYRSGSDQDKAKGDAVKAYYSGGEEVQGDWLSMLAVYRDWIVQRKSKQWCKDNFIVWKTLNVTCRESLNIASSLKQMSLLSEHVFLCIEDEAKMIPTKAVIQSVVSDEEAEAPVGKRERARTFPRMLWVASLAANIVTMFFIQMVSYSLTNPYDGFCKKLATEAQCLQVFSQYATDESKCGWDYAKQTCFFNEPDCSLKIILFVAIFPALFSTPLTQFVDWLIILVLSVSTRPPADGDETNSSPLSSLPPPPPPPRRPFIDQGGVALSPEPEKGHVELLKEAICAGFFMNVCVINGTMKAGYKVGRIPDKSALLHPSSVLSLVAASPRCLIYHELLNTSRLFLQGNTVIDQEMLIRISPRFCERVRLRQLCSQVFTSFTREDIGPALRSSIIGRRGIQLQELESKMNATIEVSNTSSTIRVWALEEHINAAKSYFSMFLDEQREKLRRETVELSIFKSDTRAVLSIGLSVNQLLLKGQYRKVILRGLPPEFKFSSAESKLKVLQHCGSLPPEAILDMEGIGVSSDGLSSSGLITCSLPEHCEKVVEALDRTIFLGKEVRAQSVGERTAASQPYLQDTSVKVTWNCYPSNGTANIVFLEEGYAELAAAKFGRYSLLVGGLAVSCNYSNAGHANEHIRKIMVVKNVPAGVTDAQLKCAVMGRKDIEGVVSVMLNRKVPKNLSDGSLQTDVSMFNSLWTACGEVENLTLFPPNEKNGRCKAYIRFKTPEAVEKAIHLYHDQPVHLFNAAEALVMDVKADLSVSFTIPADMFRKLEQLLLAEKARVLSLSLGVSISGPICKGTKGSTIKIEAEQSVLLGTAKAGFESILGGSVLALSSPEDMALLLQKAGKSFLSKVQAERNDVYISWSNSKSSIRLFGFPSGCEEVKTIIYSYLAERKTDVVRKLSLEPRMFCTIAAERKGGMLDDWQEETGVRGVAVDWRNHCFTITGDEESVAAAENLIAAFVAAKKAELAGKGAVGSEGKGEREEEDLCIFCYTNAPDYTLQTCGHKMCRQCIARVLEMNAKPDIELRFPICCPYGSSCKEKVALRDVYACVSDPSVLQGICEQSALQFVASNPALYCFCPGLNCNQVLSATEAFASCSKCYGKYCLTCADKDGQRGVPWHAGLTCKQFQAVQRDGGESLFQQWKDSQTEGKECTSCRAFVQRAGGCDHMSCICGHQFCYQCNLPSTRPVCGSPCRS
jgi:hypothetical protein